MKDIKVVIGANFGDEGKGLMTDYFCSNLPKNEKVLNVSIDVEKEGILSFLEKKFFR